MLRTWQSLQVLQLCEKSYLSDSSIRRMTKASHVQHYATKRQKKAAKSISEGSNEDVLNFDVKNLFQHARHADETLSSSAHAPVDPLSKVKPLPERFSEVEVTIKELSSTGDGIGFSEHKDHAYVVPFTVPGDLVKAKIVHHFPSSQYSLTDFVKVLNGGHFRDDSLIQCRYFAKCGGCQLQMLPYQLQLQHKKAVVEKAYSNFSSLTPEAVPVVGETIGSPLQYGYRTKLTPHFDGPQGCMSRKARHDPQTCKAFETVPPIGFMMKGMRKTMDIEDCPIGTQAVREGLKAERARVIEEIARYRKGATLLLRESTSRVPKETEAKPGNLRGASDNQSLVSNALEVPSNDVVHDNKQLLSEVSASKEIKTCVTDQKAVATEYVDHFVFKNTAGAFFQNNNSILSEFTDYVRKRILPPLIKTNTKPMKYLIDAYCGSGLFTVTLSSHFQSSIGIDIADTSIAAAKGNAEANNIKNATFITADASRLFEQVTFPAEKTAVVIDPPRKGCDDAFLQQLLRYGPQRIVYVSCNVHTQARDVGILVEGMGAFCKYEIESLQGFDFFPQTGHVESVAILERRA